MGNNIHLEKLPITALTQCQNILQSGFWAHIKTNGPVANWESHAFKLTWGEQQTQVLVLSRKLAVFLRIAYVPFGPELAAEPGSVATNTKLSLREKSSLLALLARELQGYIPLSTFFIRFDLPWEADPSHSLKHNSRLQKAPMGIQPATTLLIDLRLEEEQILAAMHKKNRYNIRLAKKHGVEVQQVDWRSYLEKWYTIYQETAVRDKIGIHVYQYYKNIFEQAETFPDAPKLQLYLAYHEGDTLGGIIIASYKSSCTYLYGASANIKRNLMPNYLLQWEAILAAKASGASYYDMFGIPPAADPKHPMHGLYRFKTGFGGTIIHRQGAWDYPYSFLFYFAFRLLEYLRTWYHHKLTKK